jgi:hypothetical protein
MPNEDVRAWLVRAVVTLYDMKSLNQIPSCLEIGLEKPMAEDLESF